MRNASNIENPHIPVGWESPTLGDLVRVVNGRAYSQTELLSSGTPVLRVGNLFTSKSWYYSNLTLEDDKYCDTGDLIYAWSASFGPCIWQGLKVIFHYHIWKLVPHGDEIDKAYLLRFLTHKTAEIKASGHGISMIHMTKEKMERLLVPFPELEEQKRIVAKVDELMTLCDQLEAAQKEREAARQRLSAATFVGLEERDSASNDSTNARAQFAITNLATLTKRPFAVERLRQTVRTLRCLVDW